MKIDWLTIIISFYLGFFIASSLWGWITRAAQRNTSEAIKQAKEALRVCEKWETLFNKSK